MYFSYFLLATN